ncbi:MAG TPA: hypothetical protein VHU81_00290 [Thermoanaerobaculia bacterium]|jgi:hypothetical protein|nr:hypothetical protein [Thermoanaerobaculia bacterium]
MSPQGNRRIGWREPVRARAHAAREYLPRVWYWPVASGASLAILGTVLFAIYAHELDQPLPWRAIGVVVVIGLVTSALLTMNLFLPHSIRFRESSIVVFHASRVEWIRYSTLLRCEVTSGPDPLFLGLGKASQVLLQIFLDPRVDRDRLRLFLAEKGVPLSLAPPD